MYAPRVAAPAAVAGARCQRPVCVCVCVWRRVEELVGLPACRQACMPACLQARARARARTSAACPLGELAGACCAAACATSATLGAARDSVGLRGAARRDSRAAASPEEGMAARRRAMPRTAGAGKALIVWYRLNPQRVKRLLD